MLWLQQVGQAYVGNTNLILAAAALIVPIAATPVSRLTMTAAETYQPPFRGCCSPVRCWSRPASSG
jgi:hypothetical protein